MEQRQIKFRAWDALGNEWYHPTHEAYAGRLFDLLVGLGGDLLAHTMKGIEHESNWPHRFFLMQFTGLHDKNGKEIYEGDIVRLTYKDGGSEHFAVRYTDESARFELFAKDSDGYGFNGTTDALVIGNTYENPESLTNK